MAVEIAEALCSEWGKKGVECQRFEVQRREAKRSISEWELRVHLQSAIISSVRLKSRTQN